MYTTKMGVADIYKQHTSLLKLRGKMFYGAGREHWLKGVKLSTVDLLIKEVCFAKQQTMFAISKAADLTG